MVRKTEYYIEAVHSKTERKFERTCHTADISNLIKLLGSYGWIVGIYHEHFPRIKG